GRGVGRAIFFCTMRLKAIRPEIPERAVRAGGGDVLAMTHLGHLDPFIASVMIERPICWMARREFFHFPPIAWLLRQMGTFSVDRCGIPVGSIRHAIRL